MDPKSTLLTKINRDVPSGIDWRQGAVDYVAAQFARDGRAAIEHYCLSKPFALRSHDDRMVLTEIVHYFYNFVNMIAMVRPGNGTRVLDVACGGGWVSHFLSKLGCDTFGVDISADFVELARRRLAEDPYLHINKDAASDRFAVHDLEAEPLPKARGRFDVAVLESCLHHFHDPVAATTHIAAALNDDGIAVVIEGENRIGGLKDEYLAVMHETRTLERPYARDEFIEAMEMAGLPHIEFLGQLNGWFSPNDPEALSAASRIAASANAMNLAICAKSEPVLRRFVPHYDPPAPLSPPAPPPAPVKSQRWIDRMKNRLGRAMLRRLTI